MKVFNAVLKLFKKRPLSVCFKFPQLYFCQILLEELVYIWESYRKSKKGDVFLLKHSVYNCIFLPGLLILKYQVLPINYRRYFFSIVKVIANTLKKSIDEVSAILFG